MDWPDDELVLDISRPSENAKISLLGYDGYLNWKFAEGKVKIDTDDIKFSKVKSKHAWVFKIENY